VKRHRGDTGLTIGERFVAAFLGAIWGLVIGGLLYGAIFLKSLGGLAPPDLVWATVAYSAAFGFIFGDALGDVMSAMFELFFHRAARDQDPDMQVGSGVGPT
jgi:hypothetical protein